MYELGWKNLVTSSWQGVLMPAGTPRPIVEKLNATLSAAVNGAELRNRLTAMGLEPATSTPEGLASFQRSEREKWQKVIADAKIKVE